MRRAVIRRVVIILGLLSLVALGSVLFSLKQKHDACWGQVVSKVSKAEDVEALFKAELSRFQVLVEQSLVARTKILSVLKNLRMKKDRPLSGRDLEMLRSGTVFYLDLREQLYDAAERYECTIDVGRVYLKSHGIDPLLRDKAVMLSLAAALTLNDNWILAVAAFENEPRLRRILDDPDSGFGFDRGSLTSMRLAANSLAIRERVRRAMRFYEKRSKSNELHSRAVLDRDYLYLDLLIRTSPSYNMIRERQAGTFLAMQLDAVGRISTDFVHDLGKDGMDLLSKFFGNTVGLVETRKGKLYGKAEVIENLAETLKPLDILLEKTPFRLTDKFIPGHFGHVAIWLGTESELKNLGLWEHPVVRPYHDELCAKPNQDEHQGALVVEALRSGVQLSALEDFLNIDDLAVLRPAPVTSNPDPVKRKALTEEALLLAFRQLGKEYDFNFDVNSTDKIVCSELVYVSFPSIPWPTERVVGRYTISPDNVAKLALEDSQLELVAFYHDGKPVNSSKNMEKFRELLKAAADQYQDGGLGK